MTDEQIAEIRKEIGYLRKDLEWIEGILEDGEEADVTEYRDAVRMIRDSLWRLDEHTYEAKEAIK